MLEQGGGREAGPDWGSETIRGCHSWEQVEREYGKDNRWVYFVGEISSSAGHKYFNCEY